MDYLEICLVSVVVIALGIFMVRKPELCWKLKHALDTEGGEPSRHYLATVTLPDPGGRGPGIEAKEELHGTAPHSRRRLGGLV